MNTKKLKRVILLSLAVISLSLFFTSVITAQEDQKNKIIIFTEQEVRVVDGDTVVITKSDKKWRIRLLGIDAPELGQTCTSRENNFAWPCGIKSKEILGKKLDDCGKNYIQCFIETNGIDKYNRVIGIIRKNIPQLQDVYDVNKAMVREGWAVAYKHFSSLYINDEKEARTDNYGIWASDFVMPREYRKEQKHRNELWFWVE